MDLGPHDVHFVFSPDQERLKCYDTAGKLLFTAACRNRVVNEGSYGHDGWIPAGEYLFLKPIPKDTVPLGAWFIPIVDSVPNGPLEQHGRVGLGAHGGGTGLAQPLAPEQGWQITRGCLRLLNSSLARVVQIVNMALRKGKCHLTVLPRGTGTRPSDAEPAAAMTVELAEGE